ncbi:MAG: DUF3365 domain-containing protein [Holophagaceae bacterium]|nr:DUF3365 domain-containing protein [Holophagaceae bacterium]
MGLRVKFNLVLLLVFLVGLGASGYVSYGLLQRNAREDVLRTAGVMMEAAASMRSYTVGQVRPNLRVVDGEFLPQSVPAYSATEIMLQLKKKYPDYAYKEAALNPTNPRNRAVEWETDIVNEFRNHEDRHEFTGVRSTPTGLSLYLARPLQVKDAACLSCHTTPDTAPAAMVKLYGPGNGFGWKLSEIVGAQIVSVPMALPVANAQRAFYTFMASLAGVFALLFIILNLMLSTLVVRPLGRMSSVADKISTGEMDMPDLPEGGSDEIAVLAKSINRMHRSLDKAIRMIDEG